MGWIGRRRAVHRPVADADGPREVQYLVSSDATSFTLTIEPEAAEFEFPPHARVLLSFRGGPSLQYVEVAHSADRLTIWRPGDVEVWATTTDGAAQIAGFADAPAPWLDTADGEDASPPWSWPPAPNER